MGGRRSRRGGRCLSGGSGRIRGRPPLAQSLAERGRPPGNCVRHRIGPCLGRGHPADGAIPCIRPDRLFGATACGTGSRHDPRCDRAPCTGGRDDRPAAVGAGDLGVLAGHRLHLRGVHRRPAGRLGCRRLRDADLPAREGRSDRSRTLHAGRNTSGFLISPGIGIGAVPDLRSRFPRLGVGPASALHLAGTQTNSLRAA